jgi:hypothetical protein
MKIIVDNDTPALLFIWKVVAKRLLDKCSGKGFAQKKTIIKRRKSFH